MRPLNLLPFFFISFVQFTTSFASHDDDTLYPNCNQSFSCGPFHDLSYPFTGGQRPANCGPPEFHLSCSNDAAEMIIDSLSYRVIKLDQTLHTMILARSDLSNSTCLQRFFNTTLNVSIFDFYTENEMITLFYGCSSIMSYKPLNLFYCNIDSNHSDAYYVIGAVPSDPILGIIQCRVSVTVPIMLSLVDKIAENRSLLGEVMSEGFHVNYSNPYAYECAKCLDSGAVCGFDEKFGGPICICGDRICAGSKKSSVSLGVGVGIGGAGIVGILLGGGFLLLIQRKRKKAAAAKSTSKDLTPPTPSSKSLPTPSTNLSQSIPSYPSSKSDLEKGSTYFGVQVFSYTELEEATDNFDPSKELGDGGFGTVYYGVLHDGRIVAVKRLYENNFKRVEQFMNEVEILTRLRHQNLVTLYGCTSRRSRELLLVYEYIPNGTVADHLHGKRSSNGFLSWPVRLSIAVETADALAYLHASDIIHRDVKTNNILLDNNFRVKVADFGLSRLFPTDVTHVSTAPQGTPGYVDPEYYQCYQLTDKSDVYSFGVVLIELISSLQAVDTSRQRLDINLANMAINKIQNHTLPELVDPRLGFEKDYTIRRMVTSAAELAFRCLQQERDMRPTMDQVLEMLRKIQKEDFSVERAEVVDISADDIGLLKHIPPPLSPDSVVTDKWVSSSTPPNSF